MRFLLIIFSIWWIVCICFGEITYESQPPKNKFLVNLGLKTLIAIFFTLLTGIPLLLLGGDCIMFDINIYQIIFLVLFIYHLIMFRVEKAGGHYEDDVEEIEIIEDDFTPGTNLLIGIVIDMVIAIILTLIIFGINVWLN